MPNPDPTPITPALVEGVLIDAFPGAELSKSDAIGRRRVFTVAFSEFTLTITTPEHAGMQGKTSFRFRRDIHSQKRRPADRGATVRVRNINKTFAWDEAEDLAREISRSRSYIMGIVMALQQAFSEGPPPPGGNIFD